MYMLLPQDPICQMQMAHLLARQVRDTAGTCSALQAVSGVKPPGEQVSRPRRDMFRAARCPTYLIDSGPQPRVRRQDCRGITCAWPVDTMYIFMGPSMVSGLAAGESVWIKLETVALDSIHVKDHPKGIGARPKTDPKHAAKGL